MASLSAQLDGEYRLESSEGAFMQPICPLPGVQQSQRSAACASATPAPAAAAPRTTVAGAAR